MDVRPEALAIIAGMALVTYLPRATGIWFAGRMRMSDRLRAWLESLPGAILISMLAPGLAKAGPPEWAATAVTVAVAWRTRGLLPGLLAGVVVVVLLRHLLGT
jgi:uncharacterized membrane protein